MNITINTATMALRHSPDHIALANRLTNPNPPTRTAPKMRKSCPSSGP